MFQIKKTIAKKFAFIVQMMSFAWIVLSCYGVAVSKRCQQKWQPLLFQFDPETNDFFKKKSNVLGTYVEKLEKTTCFYRGKAFRQCVLATFCFLCVLCFHFGVSSLLRILLCIKKAKVIFSFTMEMVIVNNMAAVNTNRRLLKRNRIRRDREHPVEVFSDEKVFQKFR